MGASASVVATAADTSPLLLFTDITFSNSSQMRDHTALMVRALNTLQPDLVDMTSTNTNFSGRFVGNATMTPNSTLGGTPPRRFDKVFALERTGTLRSTLIEVAVPSAVWAEATQRQHPASASASTPSGSPEEPDPDAEVTVGSLPGGISCVSWVGGDAPAAALPASALEALRQRGVTPALKLAGFCYGASLTNCSLFVCHRLNWKAGVDHDTKVDTEGAVAK